MGSNESVEQIRSLCVKGVCDATFPGLHHIHECVLMSSFCKCFPSCVQAGHLSDLSAMGCPQEWKTWSGAMEFQ